MIRLPQLQEKILIAALVTLIAQPICAHISKSKTIFNTPSKYSVPSSVFESLEKKPPIFVSTIVHEDRYHSLKEKSIELDNVEIAKFIAYEPEILRHRFAAAKSLHILKLVNDLDRDQKIYFQVSDPNIDLLSKVVVYSQNHEWITQGYTGAFLPSGFGDLSPRRFPLFIKSGQTLLVLYKTRADIGFTAANPTFSEATEMRILTIAYIAIAGLLTLAFYNLLIGILIREKTYYFYFGQSIFAILSVANQDIILTEYFGNYATQTVWFMNCLAPLLICGFARNLMNIKEHFPRLNFYLYCYAFIPSILFLVPNYDGLTNVPFEMRFEVFNGLAYLAIGLLFILLIIISIFLYIKKRTVMSKWFIIAFTPVLIVSIYQSVGWGLFGPEAPYKQFSKELLNFALLFEALVFSFALAVRHKLTKERLLNTETRLVERFKKVLEYSVSRNQTLEQFFEQFKSIVCSDISRLQGGTFQLKLDHVCLFEIGVPSSENASILYSTENTVIPHYDRDFAKNASEEIIPKTREKLTFEILLTSGEQNFGSIIIYYDEKPLKNDERMYIQSLANVFTSAILDQIYLKDQRKKVLLETDLEAASLVQDTLLPDNFSIPHFDFSYFYRSADRAGGDWFSHYYDPTTKMCFIFCGDVVGHGISAAIMTGLITGAVETSLSHYFKNEPFNFNHPEKFLNKIMSTINKVICSSAKKMKRDMTLCLVAIHTQTGNTWVTSAGHNFPFLIGKEKVTRCGKPGNKLGDAPKDYTWQVENVSLNPGDAVMVYTDGLIENKGASGKRLRYSNIRKLASELHSERANIIVSEIEKRGISIWGDHPAEDDCMVALYKWTG